MKSLACLVTVCLGFAAICQQPTPSESPKLRIGALNIEWLGQPSRRSRPAKDIAQDPKDIAAYIQASGVDVLALEEISDDDGVAETYTNKTLDGTMVELNKDGKAKWKYRLVPKNPQAENSHDQLIGLAWNEAIVSVMKSSDGDEMFRPKMQVPPDVKVGAPGKPAFERWTSAMKFSAGPGKTDVVVMPIHLKSNKPAFEGQDTAAQREVEAKMLLETLPEVKSKFHDEDIIIIGDTNFIKHDEKADAALTVAGFVDLNAADTMTFWTERYKNAFDRAFVPNPSKPSAKEFVNSKQEVFLHPKMSAEEYRNKISDHRMIRITVDVMEDDD